jgi:hypothetical protein
MPGEDLQISLGSGDVWLSSSSPSGSGGRSHGRSGGRCAAPPQIRAFFSSFGGRGFQCFPAALGVRRCNAPKPAPCVSWRSRHNTHGVALETPTRHNVHIENIHIMRVESSSNSYTSSRWNPQKNIITTKTPRVQNIQIYIQRSKSYIKQIASEYGQECKWA